MSRLNRRDFLIGAGGIAVGAIAAHFGSRYWLFNHTQVGKHYVLKSKQDELEQMLLPKTGVTLPVTLNDSAKRLAEEGVIDVDKWNRLYTKRKVAVPDWIAKSLVAESQTPIQFDSTSAPLLLNILWALGISNKTAFNEKSPLQGKTVGRFASTGGWRLGTEKNGAAYFNKVANVSLDEDQEQLVHRMANSIFRPCCNNSTFFQDCNHGSAMLGLLELGASQGKTEDQLYDMALKANIYWFPQQYLNIAFYFEEMEGKDYKSLSASELLSRDYSSASGFKGNVMRKLAQNDLVPGSSRRGSKGCSV